MSQSGETSRNEEKHIQGGHLPLSAHFTCIQRHTFRMPYVGHTILCLLKK